MYFLTLLMYCIDFEINFLFLCQAFEEKMTHISLLKPECFGDGKRPISSS